jgi:predicted RNA-binding protein with PUA-like domain
MNSAPGRRAPAVYTGAMACWLLKSEPSAYPWSRLVAEGRCAWDGVRNAQARINLRAMKRGDRCLFYHSNEGLEIVGVAKVVREAYPDPTADEPVWVAVDVAPDHPLRSPVPLAALKADRRTAGMNLIRQSRLSVCAVTDAEFDAVLELSGSGAPHRPAARAPRRGAAGGPGRDGAGETPRAAAPGPRRRPGSRSAPRRAGPRGRAR